MVKLSDYVIDFIADLGVGHIFMVPGGGAMHLNNSLGRSRRIKFVCNLHEQASAIAAEAYARVTNNLGVALVTTGPGGTNALTGVAAAWLDSTPCLFISGQVKRSNLKERYGVRQLGVQEIGIVPIVSSITKYAVTVMDPYAIRYHLEKAVFLAKSGRPGPVWLDIPLDVQAAIIDLKKLKSFKKPNNSSSGLVGDRLTKKVSKVIGLLNASERPVILAGNGIRLAGGKNEFLSLVDKFKIPVLTTWLGLDLIPDAHKLFFGRPGGIAPRGANFILQNSDFLLSIGSRLDMAMVGYAYDKLARLAKKVIVDIDPAEINKINADIAIPVCVDARLFIEEMLRQKDKLRQKPRLSWIKRCREWKIKYPVVLPRYRSLKRYVSTYVFTDMLCNELKEGDIIVPMSAGFCSELFFLSFRTKKGQRVFHNRGTGSMGLAIPSSIGACLASGLKRTVCLEGDGGFQFNTQELETIKRLKLPIKIFVFNNQGYASIRASQMRYFGNKVGADQSSGLTFPDTIKIAKAYGFKTERILNHYHMKSLIRKTLNTQGPVLCEVMIKPDEIRAPVLSTRQQADGTMVSSPLEDLWPFLSRKEFLSNMIIPPV